MAMAPAAVPVTAPAMETVPAPALALARASATQTAPATVTTTAVLVAARELGAREGIEVGYATSADAGGDRESVVGYVGCHLP